MGVEGGDAEDGGWSRASGFVIKTLVIIGGALLLRRLTKSKTRRDHARLVSHSLCGEKVCPFFFTFCVGWVELRLNFVILFYFLKTYSLHIWVMLQLKWCSLFHPSFLFLFVREEGDWGCILWVFFIFWRHPSCISGLCPNWNVFCFWFCSYRIHGSKLQEILIIISIWGNCTLFYLLMSTVLR